MTQIDFSNVEIRVQALTPNVAVLFGLGGNMTIFHGSECVVLTDNQFAPLSAKIEAAAASLNASPITNVLNTHWHFDHTGGNEHFGGKNIRIIGHENVRKRMLSGGVTTGVVVPPAPVAALPVITFRDELQLHFNNQDLHLIHMEHGHTDGDSVVWWKDANILQTADLFVNKVSLPHIDVSSGGSAPGMLAALDKILGMINDETRVIPGHGEVATKQDVIDYRNVLEDMIEIIRVQKVRGKSLDEIQATKPADKFNIWQPAYISPDAFVQMVFLTLDGPKLDN